MMWNTDVEKDMIFYIKDYPMRKRKQPWRWAWFNTNLSLLKMAKEIEKLLQQPFLYVFAITCNLHSMMKEHSIKANTTANIDSYASTFMSNSTTTRDGW